MYTHKLVLLAALAVAGTAMAGFTPPAYAAGYVSISVGRPPPPLRYEPVPALRPGFVWAPGYWRWGGNDYVWVGGTWQRSRRGYVYHSPRWMSSRNHWMYQEGRWDRDRNEHRDHNRDDDRHH